jgi:hypothetical protein
VASVVCVGDASAKIKKNRLYVFGKRVQRRMFGLRLLLFCLFFVAGVVCVGDTNAKIKKK